jgi:mRNA interferase HigB
VRIIKEDFLKQAAMQYPKAAKYLHAWGRNAKRAAWQNLVDVRRDYPATDATVTRSGRRVLIFNVCGNDYRFICAAHFNRQHIYTLRFLTHAEYSKNNWKNEL